MVGFKYKITSGTKVVAATAVEGSAVALPIFLGPYAGETQRESLQLRARTSAFRLTIAESYFTLGMFEICL
jgi:hypothetical protein